MRFPQPVARLVLNTRHLPATVGAVSTGLDAFIHAADLRAIGGARRANFGADLAKTMLKLRVAELKIGRCLADLGTVHQESEVFWIYVLAAGLEAKVQGGLQANLMTPAASLDAGLHGVFSGGVGWLMQGILLK